MPSERFLVRLNESKWIFEHNGTAIGEFVSRHEAIAAARARARELRGELAIERDDGTLERERFGREPRDTKG
jgi:hypothetical protein